MNHTIYTDVSGNLHRLNHAKPGPKSRGYTKILVNIPAEYVELMKWKNEQCGGLNPVSEQIRQAIRGHLCGLVYARPIGLTEPNGASVDAEFRLRRKGKIE